MRAWKWAIVDCFAGLINNYNTKQMNKIITIKHKQYERGLKERKKIETKKI